MTPTIVRHLRLMKQLLIIYIVAFVLALAGGLFSGCSTLHPSPDEPDVQKWIRGHLWEGYRNRHNAVLMHAQDCPNPGHTLMIHDTVIVHDTINYITTNPLNR